MRKSIAILLIPAIALLTMCSEEPTKPADQAPEIPPVSTIKMDFEDFVSPSLAKAASMNNWLWAAGNVAVWNTVISATLAVPIAAFAESFSHSPSPQPDGSWLWSYSVNVLGIAYSAELYGAIKTDGVHWDMYISQQGGFQDFHWFTGFSNRTVTEGTWDLNYSHTDPRPFLHIDWHRSEEDIAGDIKYINVLPDSPENGGYIYQAFNQPEPFTGMYDIYSASKDNLVQIKWNRDTLAGRILDPDHFADSDWHCWNENLQDVECQ